MDVGIHRKDADLEEIKRLIKPQSEREKRLRAETNY